MVIQIQQCSMQMLRTSKFFVLALIAVVATTVSADCSGYDGCESSDVLSSCSSYCEERENMHRCCTNCCGVESAGDNDSESPESEPSVESDPESDFDDNENTPPTHPNFVVLRM